MNGYYIFFLLYLFAGIGLCVAVFYWAVASGQFRDQERARYLPLLGKAPVPGGAAAGRWSRSMILTVLLICATLAFQIAAVLVLALS
jgi:cbb3-type cytochrome oxidase maturation protein